MLPVDIWTADFLDEGLVFIEASLFDSDETFQRAARTEDMLLLQTFYIDNLHIWQISCRKTITKKAERQTHVERRSSSWRTAFPSSLGGKCCEISLVQNLHTVLMGSRPGVRACTRQCGRVWALVLSLRGSRQNDREEDKLQWPPSSAPPPLCLFNLAVWPTGRVLAMLCTLQWALTNLSWRCCRWSADLWRSVWLCVLVCAVRWQLRRFLISERSCLTLLCVCRSLVYKKASALHIKYENLYQYQSIVTYGLQILFTLRFVDIGKLLSLTHDLILPCCHHNKSWFRIITETC